MFYMIFIVSIHLGMSWQIRPWDTER